MAILDDPAYAAFFGPHARAEVPIVGQIGAGDAVVVSGQIDRLAVLPDRVAIIDYKTNRCRRPMLATSRRSTWTSYAATAIWSLSFTRPAGGMLSGVDRWSASDARDRRDSRHGSGLIGVILAPRPCKIHGLQPP